MSQQKEYNLTDNVNDDFKFDIRGKKFSMKYPTTEEIEEMQRMTEELRALPKEDETRLAKSKELEEFMYRFISPVEHDVPVREALKHENVVVLQRFNTMIKTEFSLES